MAVQNGQQVPPAHFNFYLIPDGQEQEQGEAGPGPGPARPGPHFSLSLITNKSPFKTTARSGFALGF